MANSIFEEMKELDDITKYLNQGLGTEIKADTRKRPVVYGRFIAYYIAYWYYGISTTIIAEYFNRNHASVVFGKDKAYDIIMENALYQDLFLGYIDIMGFKTWTRRTSKTKTGATYFRNSTIPKRQKKLILKFR